MQTLKVYWSSSLKQGRRNFGDWLSPVLCEKLSGRRVVHARPNQCDLVAVGSLLAKVKNRFWNRTIDIWGTGLLEDIGPFHCPHRVHAVRGWLTARRLVNQEITVVGDPGLLCSLVAPPQGVTRKQFSVGVIPHYVDQEHPWVRQFLARHPGARLVDVFADTGTFIEAVAQCEIVVSSSLHGLVTADALGVPNAWMRLSEKVRGNDFKFRDYYSIYEGLEVVPFRPGPETTEEEVRTAVEGYSRPGLDRLQRRLLQSFPFPRPEEGG